MPFTRPDVISDSVSLSDKLARPVRGFIPKDGAIDTRLATVIDELAPNKHGVCVLRSEDNAFAGADELASFPPVLVFVTGVVSLIEC